MVCGRKGGREEGGREGEREGRKAGRKEGVEKRATRETRTKAFQVGIGIPGVCFPCHTIPSVLQPQVVYSYKKTILKKKEKKKKNQIIVVNSDDIPRYYIDGKMIKASLPIFSSSSSSSSSFGKGQRVEPICYTSVGKQA